MRYAFSASLRLASRATGKEKKNQSITNIYNRLEIVDLAHQKSQSREELDCELDGPAGLTTFVIHIGLLGFA